MAEGNRKDPRARVLNMTVRYKSATVDEFIENHSHDISKGGIFIKTRAPFPAGTLLKFEVRIAEDQRLMQGVGRVVWRREPERAEEGFPAGMGIKFIKTGEGAAELIAQIIASREGEESSFDAGVRAGLEAEGARSEGGARVSAPPAAAVEASQPPADAPTLQVESGPLSMPVDGEFRVSSPAKKRQGQVSETRKVVLQGTASGAPSSDKTPVSTPARIVAAQEERAPSREAPPAKERSSIVDETTAPRARSSADPESAGSKAERSSNPSVLGLVAILGAIGLTVLLVNRIRGPEAAAPEASTVTAPAPPAAAPPAPLAAPPTLPAPPPEVGEGAPPGDVGATATAPSASLGIPPNAALGAPAAAPGTPSAAHPPAVTAPAGTAPPVTPPPATGTKAVVPPVVVAKPVAPTAPAAAPKPKPPAAAVAKPPAPAKPKPDATPAEKPTGEASIRPAGEPEPTPPAASTAPAATTKPAEAKKPPPPAATPPAAEPAPSPKEPPSDDNPY